jgi:hypothetical protein
MLLEKFKHGFSIGGTTMGADLDFGELISQKLGEKLEEKREEGNPTLNKDKNIAGIKKINAIKQKF